MSTRRGLREAQQRIERLEQRLAQMDPPKVYWAQVHTEDGKFLGPRMPVTAQHGSGAHSLSPVFNLYITEKTTATGFVLYDAEDSTVPVSVSRFVVPKTANPGDTLNVKITVTP